MNALKNLNHEAALDSARNVLAVLGAGCLLGDFFTMRWFFVFPALAILGVVWAVDYRRHDFHPQETAARNAEHAYESIVGLPDCEAL